MDILLVIIHILYRLYIIKSYEKGIGLRGRTHVTSRRVVVVVVVDRQKWKRPVACSRQLNTLEMRAAEALDRNIRDLIFSDDRGLENGEVENEIRVRQRVEPVAVGEGFRVEAAEEKSGTDFPACVKDDENRGKDKQRAMISSQFITHHGQRMSNLLRSPFPRSVLDLLRP